MRSRATGTVLAGLFLVAVGGTVSAASERFVDVGGDATGESPDIVAVTFSEPEGEPTIRFEIEFAPERPVGSDGETWTDTVFVMMSEDGATDERGILEPGYTIGVHGLFLEDHLASGAFLVTEDDLWWYVVDVASDGPTLTFTLDRKLIGSPQDLHWQVLVGVERFDEEEGGGMEADMFPDDDEPPALISLDLEGY